MDFTTGPGKQITILDEKTQEISNPEEENTISYQGQLNVTIPARAVEEGTKLTIKKLEDHIDHDFGGYDTLATYGIDLDRSFNGQISLAFKFDPSSLEPAIDPEDQIMVASYDEDRDQWLEAEFYYDQIENQIVVATDHLSKWKVFTLSPNTDVVYLPNFTIYLNKKAVGNKLDYYKNVYLQEAADALDSAYKVYSNRGFNLPKKTKVYIDDYGKAAPAEYRWMWKDIKIPHDLASIEELKHACAHELFHAGQNQDLSFASMTMNRWWMEATADYAAAGPGGTGRYVALDKYFLGASLGIVNGKYEYQSARFVDYMVKYLGMDFLSIWQYTKNRWTTDIIPHIGNFIKTSTGLSFSEAYRNFVRHAIFSTDTRNYPEAILPQSFGEIRRMEGNEKTLEKTFSLAKYSSKMWTIYSKEFSGSGNRNLLVELEEDLAEDIHVDVFYFPRDSQLVSGQPAPVASLRAAGDTSNINLKMDHLLFILVTNGADSNRDAKIKISEIDLKVSPNELEADYGKSYDFTIEAKNIPPNYTAVRFIWDFGDSETEDHGNLSQDEEIVIVEEGRADTVVSHKYMEEGDYQLEVKMEGLDKKKLAQASSQIKVPEPELTVSILLPRIVIYELAEGAEEAPHTFEASAWPGGDYNFEWDFDDGSPIETTRGKKSLEGTTNSTISHTYTKIDTYKPSVTVYDQDGTKIGWDSISITLEEKEEADALVYTFNYSDAFNDIEDWAVSQALKQIGSIKIRKNGNFSYTVPEFEGTYSFWDNEPEPWYCRVEGFEIRGNYDVAGGIGTANVSFVLNANRVQESVKITTRSSPNILGYYKITRLQTDTYNYETACSGELEFTGLFKGAVLLLRGDLDCTRKGSLHSRWEEVHEPLGTDYPSLPKPTTTDKSAEYKSKHSQYSFERQ